MLEIKQDNMTFSHGGDFGDIVYSLMAVKYLCKTTGCRANYYLYPREGTTVLMSRSHADNILPLIQAQSYISYAGWSDVPLGVRADVSLRKFYTRGYNLADQLCLWLDIPCSDQHGPWLESPKINPAAKVIVARSQRYRGTRFPWKDVLDRYSNDAAFLGTESEHVDFCQTFGDIPHVITKNLLDVASIIAGCDLFIGNQSCPLAIAHGMHSAVAVEQYSPTPNCHFGRQHAWYDQLPPDEWLADYSQSRRRMA